MALDRSELTGETELLDVNADKYPVESNVEYPKLPTWRSQTVELHTVMVSA